MRTSRLSRRAVLAGTAAAAEPTAAGQAYRWRTAVMGGTGLVTGVLFHPSVRGLACARTDIGGAYRVYVATNGRGVQYGDPV